MAGKLNILFAGDFAPCRKFEQVVLDKQVQVLGEALPLVESADLSFVNLECPLTTNIQAIKKSGPALKANPACIEALTAFSIVGLANNHILDFGQQGLVDTLEACRSAGLPAIGAGESLAEAQKPSIQDVNGTQVAVIAIAEHEFNQSEDGESGGAPMDPIDNYLQIQQAKAQADIVIVTLHGGNEYFPYPRPGLRKLCHHYIDLGVQAVICHHPHVPGAYEYHRGKPIVYSLGNFIFDVAKPPKDWELGYMVNLNFSSKSKEFESMDLIPYKQSVALGGINLLKGEEKVQLLKRVETYRRNIENHQAWLHKWKGFVAKKAESYILRQFFPLAFPGVGFLARNTPLLKLFFNQSNCSAKLNMLRCQSHHETLVEAIKLKSHPKRN